MFENLNKYQATVKEGIDLNLLQFKPLKDFIGQTVKVDGFFFTNGRYGKQVVVVGNGYKINMPGRAVEEFEVIQSNPVMLKAVLDGKLMLGDIKIKDSTNGTTTIYKFIG